jgi:hypothetical protein
MPCSIVQWEFHVAACKGRQVIAMVQDSSGIAVDPDQDRFRCELRDFHTGVWCTEFSNQGQLQAEIHSHIVRLWHDESQERAQLSKRSGIFVFGSGCLAVGLFLCRELRLWRFEHDWPLLIFAAATILASLPLLYTR